MPMDASIPVTHLRLFLHDVNNELFAAVGNFQLHDLQRGKPEGEKTILAVRQAVEELSSVLSELSDYGSWASDGLTVQATALDLADVVTAGLSKAAGSLARFRKSARFERPWSPVRVSADVALAARAVHALVRVSLWREAVGDDVPVSISRDLGLGTVTVQDRGPAIPEEARSSIFTVDGILECKRRGVAPGRPTALLFARMAAEAVGGRCSASHADGMMRWTIGFPIAT